jgi:hypothetical protein
MGSMGIPRGKRLMIELYIVSILCGIGIVVLIALFILMDRLFPHRHPDTWDEEDIKKGGWWGK